MNLSRHAGLLFAHLLGILPHDAIADDTWTYAVEISATVANNQITLNWPADRYNPTSYTVSRKLVNDPSWGPGVVLPGTASGYTDTTILPGVEYEYQVFKQGIGYTGYGYICAGIEIPPVHDRGKIVLLVAADTVALATELAQLQSDLTGDGWKVIRHDVPDGALPADVKSLIVNDYLADPGRVCAAFLFGHVPILMSGTIDYDAHGARPMPADAFYGDMDGNWHPELPPDQRPSYLPSDVELMVGRVDFSNMPGIGAAVPWPSETELLRRYLQKAHAWRHKQVVVPRMALMADRSGDAIGLAYSAGGYRNLAPMLGPGAISQADVSDTAPDSARWIYRVSAEPWLWSCTYSAGTMTGIGFMGTNGAYHEAWSTDIVGLDAKAVFSMAIGSHFGEWSGTDNLLRAFLAAPSITLTICLAGLPHWYLHHMAKGYPIGYSTHLTANNSTMYLAYSNLLTRSIMVNLLGDPALRLEALAPPSNVGATVQNGTVTLAWTGSTDPVAGYHVYRSTSSAGPFVRLTSSQVTDTRFSDFPGVGAVAYMVRALALQTNASGSYYNLSQGIFTSAYVPGSPPTNIGPVTINMSLSGPVLSWSASPGVSYHVEATTESADSSGWSDISGSISTGGTGLSYTDSDWIWHPLRLYRVVAQ